MFFKRKIIFVFNTQYLTDSSYWSRQVLKAIAEARFFIKRTTLEILALFPCFNLIEVFQESKVAAILRIIILPSTCRNLLCNLHFLRVKLIHDFIAQYSAARNTLCATLYVRCRKRKVSVTLFLHSRKNVTSATKALHVNIFTSRFIFRRSTLMSDNLCQVFKMFLKCILDRLWNNLPTITLSLTSISRPSFAACILSFHVFIVDRTAALACWNSNTRNQLFWAVTSCHVPKKRPHFLRCRRSLVLKRRCLLHAVSSAALLKSTKVLPRPRCCLFAVNAAVRIFCRVTLRHIQNLFFIDPRSLR